MVKRLRSILGLAIGVAFVGPAHAEKWVGHAYSDSGDAPKIVLRGRTSFADDGTVYLTGRYRCIGACLAHRGSVNVAWWNDADGFGHQEVEVDLPGDIWCQSSALFDSAFETLPPSVGTEVTVSYDCDDGVSEVDSGTVDVTRVR